MDLNESFALLGIEKTKDKRVIKTAYRALLAQNNPEDHPEEFKRLRQAYEAAVQHADSGEEEDGTENGAKAEDLTPSGKAVREFKKIYENIHMRSNPAVFEEFFQNEVFYYLGEDELAREKILVFMMTHYYYPTEVWKILDGKLRISAGENDLREKFPPEYVNFLVAKCNNGEEVNFSQFEGPEDADYDEFIRCTERIYQALREDKLEEAENNLKAAERMEIQNPILDLSRAAILRKRNQGQDAVAVLRALHEKYPQDEVARYNYAEALWSQGEKDAAAEIYLGLKAENDKHYMSNVRLTEWYFEKKEYETAKKHAYCVIKFGCDDNFRDLLRRINDNLELKYIENIRQKNHYKDKMELCWCYLQSEKLLECMRLAKSIRDEVGDEDRTEYVGMMAKIYVECGMFEEAIPLARSWMEALQKEQPEEFESKIHTAHYLLAECFHYMAGQDSQYYEQAAAELREIGDDLQHEYGFLIKLAYIYADAAKIVECEQIARQLERKRIFLGHSILMEAYVRAGDARGIIDQSRMVVRYFPDMPRPYELAARTYYDHGVRERLAEVLEQAEKNGVETDILKAYRSLLAREDKPEDNLDERVKKIREGSMRKFRASGEEEDFEAALGELNECLNDFPGSFLLVERGLLYLSAKKYDEARKDFEKAIEDNIYNRYAWNNLGCVYLEQGQQDKAFVCFNKSICASGGEYMLPYANIADCYDAARQYEEEGQQYELLMKKFDRKDVDYYASLIEVYKNLGKWEQAQKLAMEYGGTQEKYYREILEVALEMGRMKDAENIVRQWKRMQLKAWPKKNVSFYRETSWYYLLAKDSAKAVREMAKAIKIEEEKRDNSWKLLEMYEEIIFMMYLGSSGKSKMPNAAKNYAKKINEIKAQGKINFQKKKYFLYVYDLAEMVLGNVGNAQTLLGLLEKCPRCNRCTMEDCKEFLIAKAMMLDLQGKSGVAEIYRELHKKYPCDKYVIALNKYKSH